MNLRITQHDIRNGERHSFDSNPIALAMRRQLKGEAMVGEIGVIVRDENGDHGTAPLPPEAKEWLRNYNRGGVRMEPMEFAL
jgi:hypothetical protein